ncbi:MAG: Na+:solute symporter [Gemmatimonadetes bacterium]|jgi:solute:Na+ symporter, SSS family|nr:Na+:solute symporter [Gemmatimonadota bacterium]MBT7864087.1 Na+:solute symporter [Gemmatimonadota bacterium]
MLQHLDTADLIIIGIYILFALSMGPLFYRLARRSTTDFFLSGRDLPWWLSGTSMVATTFSAGVPLLITGFIWTNGVFMNWWWWSFALSNVLTVVFFARLWRRAKVTTDVEFSELRYGGRPGAWLRGFRALYFGGIVNTFIMAWLTFGAYGIAAVLLGLDPGVRDHTEVWLVLIVLIGLVAVYSSMAGLWGVVTTDFVQFGIAIAASLYLAITVVGEVGGLAAMREQVVLLHPLKEGVLDFFPTPGLIDIPWIMLVSFFLAQWWCSYYPASEPGGGAYVAQRMLATRTEKQAQLATLWFSVAHYALRPWPWIVVALCTVILYPQHIGSTAENARQIQELTYINTVIDYMPSGWRGVMVAFLCAAFMSTVDTHLNWGASYLVRDFYARFWRPGQSEAHYVVASRFVMVMTAVAAALVAMFLIESIGDANRILVGWMAGIGLVFALRFYWWRVNAWSEISAMVSAVGVNGVLQLWVADQAWLAEAVPNASDRSAVLLMMGAAVVNVIWITVTLNTSPESAETLERFYRRVRPPGGSWKQIAAQSGVPHEPFDPKDLLAFAGGIMLIWGAIYAIGQLILGSPTSSAIGFGVTALGGWLTWQFLIKKADRADLMEGESDAHSVEAEPS